MTAFVTLVVLGLSAGLGAALRASLARWWPAAGWPLVALNCAAAMLIGGLYARVPAIGAEIAIAATGFLMACSPLSALARGTGETQPFDDICREAIRIGIAAFGHLVYAAAFAIVGYVAMFAMLRAEAY